MITSGAKSLDTFTSCLRMEVCSSLSTSVRRQRWRTIHWPIPSTVQVLKTTESVFAGQLRKNFLQLVDSGAITVIVSYVVDCAPATCV